MNSDVYFDFLRFCIDEHHPVPKDIDLIDWQKLYTFSRQQAISSIVFSGIERYGKRMENLPKVLLLKWYGENEKIKQRNTFVNERVVDVVKVLKDEGFECCILKGQGNAVMYPNPHARTPGDIDVWITNKRRKDVISYAKKVCKDAEVRIYHVEYEYNGVPLELHFMPGVMNNFIYNYRLQKWYQARKEEQCGHCVELPDGVGQVPVPTMEFNIIFQLSHMMHHFFDEGIGLRQFIDYYYLLKTYGKNSDTHENMTATLKHLGLWKFAKAAMYIEHKVLGLEQKYLVAPIDERRGKTLLKEILKGGNFGQYSGLTKHTTAKKYFLKNWRSLQFVREYPEEALSEPIFRTYHFFWRMCSSNK